MKYETEVAFADRKWFPSIIPDDVKPRINFHLKATFSSTANLYH